MTRFDFCCAKSAATVPATSKACPSLRRSRQLPRTNRAPCIFMHLTYLPYLAASGELRPNRPQHSVKELQQHRIAPDISGLPFPNTNPRDRARERSPFSVNVRKEAVVAAYDLKTIYDAPPGLSRARADRPCLDASINLPAPSRTVRLARMSSDRVLQTPKGERQSRQSSASIPSLKDAYNPSHEALTPRWHGQSGQVKIEMVDPKVLIKADENPVPRPR